MPCCSQQSASYTIRRYDPDGNTLWIRDYFLNANWGSLANQTYTTWPLSAAATEAWIAVGGPMIGQKFGDQVGDKQNVATFDATTGSRFNRWNVWDDIETFGGILMDDMQLNVVDVCAGRDGSLGVLTAAADWESSAEFVPNAIGWFDVPGSDVTNIGGDGIFGQGAFWIGWNWNGGPIEQIGLIMFAFPFPAGTPLANVNLILVWTGGTNGPSTGDSPLFTINAVKGPATFPLTTAQAQANTMTSASVAVSSASAVGNYWQIDVTSIVKEVISQDGWEEGDNILFYLTPPPETVNAGHPQWNVFLGTSSGPLIFFSEQVAIVYDGATFEPRSIEVVNPLPGMQFHQIEIDSTGTIHLAGESGPSPTGIIAPGVNRDCIALTSDDQEVIGAEYPGSGNTLRALRSAPWASYINDQAPGDQNFELPASIAVDAAGGIYVAGVGFKLEGTVGFWGRFSSIGTEEFVGTLPNNGQNGVVLGSTTRIDTADDRYYLAGSLTPTVFSIDEATNDPLWGHHHQTVDDLAAVPDGAGIVTVGSRSVINSRSERSFLQL